MDKISEKCTIKYGNNEIEAAVIQNLEYHSSEIYYTPKKKKEKNVND